MTGNHATLLVLDDDADRRARMSQCLINMAFSDAAFAETGNVCISLFDDNVRTLRLLSLDHDLHMDDPLDGLDVVKELVTRHVDPPPSMIVHSSNADRSAIMMGELELAGWPAIRVPAIGVDWIETCWAPAVRSYLKG